MQCLGMMQHCWRHHQKPFPWKSMQYNVQRFALRTTFVTCFPCLRIRINASFIPIVIHVMVTHQLQIRFCMHDCQLHKQISLPSDRQQRNTWLVSVVFCTLTMLASFLYTSHVYFTTNAIDFNQITTKNSDLVEIHRVH